MKTRFCPSPTGQMHIGNVRTALFNVLLARSQRGQFLLRIEDTDKLRSQNVFTDVLQEDLRWLGLSWDEGPYWQSQRQAVYDQYYAQLEKEQRVYPCFCSDEQLALARKIQLSAGQPPRYTGTCLKLTPDQIAQKLSQGLVPTLRFKVPRQQIVEFIDLAKGLQRFNTDDIGDFIIRRADGSASFFFCNAIDDAVMGVTHAIRGEDHLTNTPRQLLILQALNLTPPQYGHISMIVGHDGAPLSKRHGSRSIQAMREEGYLALALNNYMARLGHYYEQNTLMDLQQLAEHFAYDHLGTTPAHYDETQLLHWQKAAVANLTDTEFWGWIGLPVHRLIPEKYRDLFIQVVRPNTVFPYDALFWAEIFYTDMSVSPEAEEVLKTTDAIFFTEAIQGVTSHGADFKKITAYLQQTLNIKGKALFQPLRAALTGQLHGPEMHGIIELLGSDKVCARLQKVLPRPSQAQLIAER